MATQNTTTTSIFLLQNPNSAKTNKGSISLGFFLEVFPNQPYISIPELVHSAQVRFELVLQRTGNGRNKVINNLHKNFSGRENWLAFIGKKFACSRKSS